LPLAFVLNIGPLALPDLHLLSLVQTQQDVLPQLPCVNLLHDVSKAAPDLLWQNALAVSLIKGMVGISKLSDKFK
jgi:hypothetical protein